MWKISFVCYSCVERFVDVTETETSSAGLLSPKFNVLTDNSEAGSETLAVQDSGQPVSITWDPRRPVVICPEWRIKLACVSVLRIDLLKRIT